jgi:hypothetical protein
MRGKRGRNQRQGEGPKQPEKQAKGPNQQEKQSPRDGTRTHAEESKVLRMTDFGIAFCMFEGLFCVLKGELKQICLFLVSQLLGNPQDQYFPFIMVAQALAIVVSTLKMMRKIPEEDPDSLQYYVVVNFCPLPVGKYVVPQVSAFKKYLDARMYTSTLVPSAQDMRLPHYVYETRLPHYVYEKSPPIPTIWQETWKTVNQMNSADDGHNVGLIFHSQFCILFGPTITLFSLLETGRFLYHFDLGKHDSSDTNHFCELDFAMNEMRPSLTLWRQIPEKNNCCALVLLEPAGSVPFENTEDANSFAHRFGFFATKEKNPTKSVFRYQ